MCQSEYLAIMKQARSRSVCWVTHTLVSSPSQPRFKALRQIMLLLRGNVAEFRWKPFLLYHSESPRVFKNVSRYMLPICYHYKKRTWMTLAPFKGWFSNFHRQETIWGRHRPIQESSYLRGCFRAPTAIQAQTSCCKCCTFANKQSYARSIHAPTCHSYVQSTLFMPFV